AFRGLGEPDHPTRRLVALLDDERVGVRRPLPTRRERLAHHVIAMRRERIHYLRIPFDLEHDAVRHLEVRPLTGLLHGAHELAREALALELAVQRRIEPDEEAALLRARETLGGRRLDQERQ